MDGMLFPMVFTIVTKAHLSAEVIALTCFLPQLAITLSGFWTVVISFSSMFQIADSTNLYLSSSSI